MTSDPDSMVDDDPRVLQISREYLADLEAGRRPDRQAYLSRYPELAECLSEYLDGIDLAQTLRPMVSPPPAEHTSQPLGDFQIIREVGRGGMGIVYEAVQLSLGRKVALKVLPFAAALDSKHLQRFKTEAYAAAQLHHTHIVPVYAVGCERGMHFYAMQLIEGRSIADVISELKDQAATLETGPESLDTVLHAGGSTWQDSVSGRSSHSSRSSSRSVRTRDRFRSAARIAAEVADALEYAHESGVVHRDIKPANLLLDGKGTVWVTDFGLAHVATDVGVTQTGDVLGTLRYMSPEQAAGRRIPVDHRADVYSLGATLYEFLTLEPIFPGQDRPALLQQILNDDPRPLRLIDKSIPVELETIVLKSISKLPSERYSSAGEMAADLHRFLTEIPILARRPTLIDRCRKWMRRHPAFVAASVILLIFSLIGSAITAAIVARAHNNVELAYQRELQRAVEAESQFNLARRVVDDMIQLADEELSDAPFQEGLRKRLLEAALEYYQVFIETKGTASLKETNLAETRDRIIRILADLALVQAERQRFLLKEVAVLDDLKVSPDQRKKVAELIERLDASRLEGTRSDGSRYSREPFSKGLQQHFVEMARTNEAAFSAILTPQQIERLRQIALQCQGPFAFRELDIARTLHITATQKDRIRKIIGEMLFRRDDRPRSESRTPQDRERRVRSATQQIMAILTAEQRATWDKMAGIPYAGPFVIPRRDGGSPGGQSGPSRENFHGPRPPF